MFGDSEFQFPFDDDDLQAMPDLEALPSTASTMRDAALRDAFDEHRPAAQLPVPPLPTERLPVASVTPESPPVATSELPTPRRVAFDEQPTVLTPREPVASPELPSPQSNPVSPPREPPTSPWREPLPVSVRREPSAPTSSQREIPRATQAQSKKTPGRSVLRRPPVATRSSDRPTRNRVAPTRYTFDGVNGYAACTNFQESFPEAEIPDLQINKATVSDPDTLGWDEAMAESEPHRSHWLKAAQSEISALEGKHCWQEVPNTEATNKILPGTWVFRRKRTPDGEVKKYKARYCCRGDLEETSEETYAPVVAWSSVRLFLVLSITLGWQTCSIDFSNAFVQATLNKSVWIHLPRGFVSKQGRNTCLRLNKSLYGLSVAPRLWFKHLMAEMLRLGFVQSVHDPCLLFKSGMCIVLYVDDAGISAAKKEDVDKLVSDLRSHGFELTQEGDFSEFLGIKFEYSNDGKTLTMTQKGLIQKVIKAAHMEDCNPNWTPASSQALGIDPDGAVMHEEWNYRSIVGMLLYLSTNTRPDIAFAVSQVARFSHNPKDSHATAIKMIIRYLARTFDKGTIVSPTGTFNMDTYCDADFAGLYRRDPDLEPTAVKSRTGFIVKLGGCPLVWKSKLQTEISLSTLESEYSALSYTMRTVLSIRNILLETIQALDLPATLMSTMTSRVFEDNAGALLLGTQHRITNRTKYFLVKWHHFWNAVKEGVVTIHKVDTKEQRADYLTKGLVRELFEHIRYLNQGW